MKKLVAIVLTFLLILTGCSTIKVKKIDDDIKTDNLKFKKEYTEIKEDNIYEYTTYDNVMDLIENGSGIIYFGYPDCSLCNDVVPILNDIAEEKEVKTIMYYNFKEIKDNNTNEYIKLIDVLKSHLETTFEEITAPTIVFIGNDKSVNIYIGDSSKEILSIEEKEAMKNDFNIMIDKMLEENNENEVIDN